MHKKLIERNAEEEEEETEKEEGNVAMNIFSYTEVLHSKCPLRKYDSTWNVNWKCIALLCETESAL